MSGLVGGRSVVKVGSLLALILVGALLFNVADIRITGFVVYKNTSIEENTADGEGTTFSDGTILSGDYTSTQANDGTEEWIRENSSKRLRWNYDFNTTYNDTQPAKIDIFVYNVNFRECLNVTIYNYQNSTWDYLNQTQTCDSATYENLTATLSWSDKNMSEYVNSTNGQIKILFEDINITDTQYTMLIDYLAINVTVSPFWAQWLNLTYSNGSVLEQNGLNFTRTDALNMSVRWNASEYSVISGTVILNNSNGGEEEEYSISLMADFISFDGNWTNYTINLTNSSLFKLGGNWTVKMKAQDSFYQENTSIVMADFGLWANAKVTQVTSNESGNRTLGNRQILLQCRVLDNESSEQVNQHNVSFWNGSTYIGSALTNATGWAAQTYTETSTAVLNYTIICNITDQPEILYNASAQDSQNFTLEIMTDSVAPVINSLQFQYRGLTTNTTNLYANLTILLNVTDNSTNATSIATVKVNVTYPDGGIIEGGTMQQNSSSEDMWSIFFNITNDEMPINATGIYGVNVSAWDLSDNLAYADWNNYSANFTAYSHLNVTLEYYVDNTTSYNRGEKLTLYARDVNGIIMTNLNWTVNITRYNETEVNLSDATGVANYTLSANVSDPVGNWSIEVINVTDNVTKVNEGNETFIFNITRTLTPYFTGDLYVDRAYGLSQDVNSVTPIYVRVNYSRGANTNYSMSVNLSYGGTNHSMNRSGTPTYSNSSMVITSTGSYSAYFTLYAYAGDDYNNTGSGSIRLVTSAQPSSGGSGGGGGGYVEVSVNVTLNASCNCTGWGNVGCGIGGCGVNDMYQERVCTPSGCDNENRCLRNYSMCISLVRDFNITSDRTDVEMESGEDRAVTITLYNTGETNLTINLSVEKNCCDVSFLQKTLNLSEQASLDIPLVIHSKLLENPGNYIITVRVQFGWLEKTRAIRVKINKNPSLAEVGKLEGELAGIEAQIAEYKASGVYVAALEGRADEIRQALKEADNSITGDDLEVLKERISFASAGIETTRVEFTNLVVQKAILDNKWWIILGVIVAIIASYLISEVVVPVHRLTREIKKFSSGEKEMVQKRKEIEKQYFMGKINEKAFNEMLIGEQGKILGARGKAIKMAKERTLILKTKLSPREMFNWLRAGPKGLARRIRNLGRRVKKPDK